MIKEQIKDKEFYRPKFSPWLGYGEFKTYHALTYKLTLVDSDRCYALYCLLLHALQIDGEIWECGVYKGGTAVMMAEIIRNKGVNKTLRLFDTFEGMPETGDKDWHKKGDFNDTSLEAVQKVVGQDSFIQYHKGFMPNTFVESKIAMAHIDVDLYQSVLDCCNFIYPRMSAGGFMVFDDYGFDSCPGARQAVDEFFADKKEVPLLTPAGHAIVFKI
jgi:O-methyltransferase